MTSMLNLGVIVLVLTIGTNLALKCYICNSEDAPECEIKPKKSIIQECNYKKNIERSATNKKWWDDIIKVDYQHNDEVEPPVICQKFVIDNTEADKKSVVIRTCQVATNDPTPCNFSLDRATFMRKTGSGFTCESCETDACNSGEITRIWWPLLFTSAIVYYLRI